MVVSRFRRFPHPQKVESMSNVLPMYIAIPYQDSAEAGRLILRDGTTAFLRKARPDDCEELEAFFLRLSPEARWRRFFSASMPSSRMIAELCNGAGPQPAMTLLV